MRQIVLNLYDLEMITQGYAYFTFAMTPHDCKGGNDGRDQDACKAFEGIMDISNYVPSNQKYKMFEESVRQKMPLFAGLGHHMLPNEEVRSKNCLNLYIASRSSSVLPMVDDLVMSSSL